MNEPQKKPRVTVYSSENSCVFVIRGPGDKTRRPRRPNIPRDWPGRQPPQQSSDQPPPEEPPKSGA
jgi:hypothetical protein